jgi:hypothetical protein
MASKKELHRTPPQAEQILYLGAEEHLSSVLERIEGATAQRVIVVIPAHTQMRSHVAWRLLQKRAHELGKDVAIVSADRQIRALARSVHFEVVT